MEGHLERNFIRGQHVTLIGKTGSGKTHMALALAEIRPYVIIAATKRRDPLLQEAGRGYKVVETQSVQRGDGSGLIYEIHFENNKEIAKVQFATDGKVLERSAKAKTTRGK